MKTNIAGLMNVIAEDEKKLSNIAASLRTNVYSVSIQELDGTVNVLDDTKKDFSSNLVLYKNIIDEITKLKSILLEKNNSFKLSDGRSIQTAIIDNNNLRRLKLMYENFLQYNDTKKRFTEVNNSYFECKNINFDREEVKRDLEDITNKIQKTDFEISKLNSIEFEI